MLLKLLSKGLLWFLHHRSTLCFFSNLFQGQITQKHIDQISSPENKKKDLVPLLLKSLGVWGWFIPKTFQGEHFLFSGELIWSICFWVICPWNKFEERWQCEILTIPLDKLPCIRGRFSIVFSGILGHLNNACCFLKCA